jgi:hypothetical protein
VKLSYLATLIGSCLLLLLTACSSFSGTHGLAGSGMIPPAGIRAIEETKTKLAPDPHMAICAIGLDVERSVLVLTGEVERVEFKQEAIDALKRSGVKAEDRVTVLPAEELGEKVWGIVCLSVASGREYPDHKAEMGTQILMGQVVRVWKRQRHWLYVQSPDSYLSWVESGAVALCTRAQVDKWERSEQVIVTAFDERVLEGPSLEALPVSDVVMGDRLKIASAPNGLWLPVELPDGRAGWLSQNAATNYAGWRESRHATPENIEKTATMFLGRPYLWGGTSPKGLDCSGFCKLVFMLNGIELPRNASEQARQGKPVELGEDFSHLKKGDLLFFGWPARGDRPEWISHVAIYLGGKRFIQSAQMVKISSLDPASPIYDAGHARGLLVARRILPDAAVDP